MAPLHIRLLGNVDLRIGGSPVSLESGRAESLLAYLVVHRDAPQPEQRLAFLLWPDSTRRRPARTCGTCSTRCAARFPTPTGSSRSPPHPAWRRTRRSGSTSPTFEAGARRRPPARRDRGRIPATCSRAATTSGCSRSATACRDRYLGRPRPARTLLEERGDHARRSAAPSGSCASIRCARSRTRPDAPTRRTRRPRAGGARLPRVRAALERELASSRRRPPARLRGAAAGRRRRRRRAAAPRRSSGGRPSAPS